MTKVVKWKGKRYCVRSDEPAYISEGVVNYEKDAKSEDRPVLFAANYCINPSFMGELVLCWGEGRTFH